MTKTDKKFSKEGAYSRSRDLIIKDKVDCMICEEKSSGILVDTSDEEYTPAEICNRCLLILSTGKMP